MPFYRWGVRCFHFVTVHKQTLMLSTPRRRMNRSFDFQIYTSGVALHVKRRGRNVDWVNSTRRSTARNILYPFFFCCHFYPCGRVFLNSLSKECDTSWLHKIRVSFQLQSAAVSEFTRRTKFNTSMCHWWSHTPMGNGHYVNTARLKEENCGRKWGKDKGRKSIRRREMWPDGGPKGWAWSPYPSCIDIL